MSLFSKGNWTRFSIPSDGWKAWVDLMANPRQLFISSSFAARTKLLVSPEMETACGINPPCWPCGDAPFPREQHVLDQKIHPWIAHNIADESNMMPWGLPVSLTDETGIYLLGERYWGENKLQYQLLDSSTKLIGFWVVLHRREALDDINALREHSAATINGMPFKLLSSALRTEINKSLESDGFVDYISRCQCPAILNFETGEVWLGTSSKKLVEAFRFWLGIRLKVQADPMTLRMGGNSNWPQLALEAFLAQDIFKLEREEALEAALKEGEPAGDLEDEESEDGPGIIVMSGTAFKGVQTFLNDSGEPKQEAFKLDNLAVWSPDNIKFAIVGMDASLHPLVSRHNSVLAKDAADALAILKNLEGSSLGSARVTFTDNIGEGVAEVQVELSELLTAATYKGLELTYDDAAADGLEVGEIGTLLTDYRLKIASPVPVVNAYWFRYYLQLLFAERLIIDVCAAALDLDPLLIAPQAAGVQQSEATPGARN